MMVLTLYRVLLNISDSNRSLLNTKQGAIGALPNKPGCPDGVNVDCEATSYRAYCSLCKGDSYTNRRVDDHCATKIIFIYFTHIA